MSPRASFAAPALAATLCLVGAVLAEESASVSFLTPRSFATVVGKGEIELAVETPPGARAERVVVSVDGKKIATLTGPPWKTAWDAGEAIEPHFLEAVAYFSNGAEARASLSTSALKIDYYEQVSLVNVYAIVRDAKGRYVADLPKERFFLAENGRPQVIQRFSDEWKPLRVAFVLDTSLSMQDDDKIEAARNAARSFLDILGPQDQGMVVAFHDRVEVLQDLTPDRDKLAAAIVGTHAQGGTALYDGIWKAADLLDRAEGRRVMVLLSDGRDEAANGLEPGSFHNMNEALDRALRSETMIFAIGFGRNLAAEFDFSRRYSLESILRNLSESTGGRAIFSSRVGKLKSVFMEVADDLRHQYSLAYKSDDPRRDGTWREIRLRTDRPDLVVVARRGYFAPKDPTPVREAPKKKSG